MHFDVHVFFSSEMKSMGTRDTPNYDVTKDPVAYMEIQNSFKNGHVIYHLNAFD